VPMTRSEIGFGDQRRSQNSYAGNRRQEEPIASSGAVRNSVVRGLDMLLSLKGMYDRRLQAFGERDNLIMSPGASGAPLETCICRGLDGSPLTSTVERRGFSWGNSLKYITTIWWMRYRSSIFRAISVSRFSGAY
jgi:hypothetical protein